MKRYEGCNGIGGWFISHLGWFIVIAVVLLLILVATKCHAQKQTQMQTVKAGIAVTNVNNQTQRQTVNACSPTLLPNELHDKQQIKHMRVGDRGVATYVTMMVDEDGKCYLHTFLPFRNEKEEKLGEIWIGLERTIEGYNVTVQLEKGKPVWQPARILFKKEKLKDGDLAPVCKITIIKKHRAIGTGVGGVK